MNAIIIAIGDELISGKTVDTNSAYLSRKLADRGIETISHRTVGDNQRAIAEVIARAARQADVVLITGGLGPTGDDLTRQATAEAMDAELVLNVQCLAEMEAFFKRRRRSMVPANRIQAMIPAGAEPLENSVGTAPGIAARIGLARVFVMPGVPHEMKHMFDSGVSPRLGAGETTIVNRIIHTFGTGESDIGEKLADLMADRTAPITIGTTVAAGLVSVRITSRAEDAGAAGLSAEAAVAEIRGRLGDMVIGEDDENLASAVGELLRQRGLTLATAESCTGGMIGEMVTAVGGASDYYLGGVTAYANEVKRDQLGVSAEILQLHGAVSEETAKALAVGCRERFSADWSVSVTGIAGPGGGSEDKPVGLVYIAVAGGENVQAYRHIFAAGRRQIRTRTALTALNHLRLAIISD